MNVGAPRFGGSFAVFHPHTDEASNALNPRTLLTMQTHWGWEKDADITQKGLCDRQSNQYRSKADVFEMGVRIDPPQNATPKQIRDAQRREKQYTDQLKAFLKENGVQFPDFSQVPASAPVAHIDTKRAAGGKTG
ncbi:MAG: hypothetical protein IPK79_04380 [Vampirovibrionales bacterium]|nr:hypothetical protein [Vampirovibrionales bacterium]